MLHWATNGHQLCKKQIDTLLIKKLKDKNKMLTNKTLVSQLSAPQQAISVATQLNDELSEQNLSKKSFTELKDRLITEKSLNQNITSKLDDAILEIQKDLPEKYATWDDFMNEVCEAKSVPLADMRIDTIMQRKLMLRWVTTILTNFEPSRIMALNAYPIKGTTQYSCWDGQHTAIVLYIIAHYVYGVALDKIKVPVVVFKGSKAAIRKNFTALNSTEGKVLLDDYDIIIQRIVSSRLDKSNSIFDIRAAKVQDICDKYDIFLTDKKFGYQDCPGAISRHREILKFVLSRGRIGVFENVAKLHNELFEDSAFDNEELNILFRFFDICATAQIAVDDDYIDSMADALKGRFDGWAGEFKGLAKSAYYDLWYSSHNSTDHPRFDAKPEQLTDYLVRILQVSTKFDNNVHSLPRIHSTHYLASSI